MRLVPGDRRADPVFGPDPDCALCPRLREFRTDWSIRESDWHNRPVPSFGDPEARLLIVGLAPGLRGANRTGRPFTGDFAGDLLYQTLAKFSFSTGRYAADPEDGVVLHDALITNAVRCVPPGNKPTTEEIATCRPFLVGLTARLPRLKAVLALGRIAHDTTLTAFGLKRASCPFGHGATHEIGNGVRLYDSYHCSRYNTNTGRLTTEMFEAVFTAIARDLERSTSDPARIASGDRCS